MNICVQHLQEDTYSSFFYICSLNHGNLYIYIFFQIFIFKYFKGKIQIWCKLPLLVTFKFDQRSKPTFISVRNATIEECCSVCYVSFNLFYVRNTSSSDPTRHNHHVSLLTIFNILTGAYRECRCCRLPAWAIICKIVLSCRMGRRCLSRLQKEVTWTLLTYFLTGRTVSSPRRPTPHICLHTRN